ncbi:glutaredoxin family protein [Propionicicella superfundia]|uniref:glutaredoxin family protein n=1 Tax=Propionicicella superfundia TaxID=348582 RepID=UPI00040BB050|nr:glutaredoxin domain-containing protein [Propionicicella superfundia]
MSLVTVYGLETCVDTVVARRVLDEAQIAYRWVDVAGDERATEAALALNGGDARWPIVALGQKVLTEPTETDLRVALRAFEDSPTA